MNIKYVKCFECNRNLHVSESFCDCYVTGTTSFLYVLSDSLFIKTFPLTKELSNTITINIILNTSNGKIKINYYTLSDDLKFLAEIDFETFNKPVSFLREKANRLINLL